MAESHSPRGLWAATAGKTVASAALRSPYLFIRPMSAGLHTSVGRLGFVLGLGELVGLLTGAIGRSIDRGHHRRWMTIGLCLVTVGAGIIPVGRTLATFGLGFGVIALGCAWFTTAGHAWIGSTVPYAERGRAMGRYEMSWALALLVSAPIFGLMISRVRWWSYAWCVSPPSQLLES